MFADNVERVFVAAQSKESGVPHFALARPFGEFYLAYRRLLYHPGFATRLGGVLGAGLIDNW